MGHTYSKAGVNIDAGDEFVQRIKKNVRSSFTPAVLTDIGAFGAFYDGRFTSMKEPILVSSVDGVGTKLKIAFLMDKHDTVGQDLVNHCVNDIAVCGARPLFFLDYIATGKLDPSLMESMIDGMVKACKENNCSLIGGETAEMPGFYRENEYDIAGMIVGVVEKSNIFDSKRVKAGDLLVGLPSTGLHTNGYSLARAVLFERFEADDFVPELNARLGDTLLAVHRSYLQAISVISSFPEVHALAHITGGGLAGNTSRVVPDGLGLRIQWKRWECQPIFKLIQKSGDVPDEEMRRTFNMGIGLILIVSPDGVDHVMTVLRKSGEHPLLVGEVARKHS